MGWMRSLCFTGRDADYVLLPWVDCGDIAHACPGYEQVDRSEARWTIEREAFGAWVYGVDVRRFAAELRPLDTVTATTRSLLLEGRRR